MVTRSVEDQVPVGSQNPFAASGGPIYPGTWQGVRPMPRLATAPALLAHEQKQVFPFLSIRLLARRPGG